MKRGKSITAGELRRVLEALADDTPVVAYGGHDHTYLAFGHVSHGWATFERGTAHECGGPDDDGAEPVAVLS